MTVVGRPIPAGRRRRAARAPRPRRGRNQMGRPSLPPGPRMPAALQAAWLAYRPYRFLERCRDRYGDAFTMATPIGRVPVFARPEHAERVFALDGDILHGGA